MLCKLYLNKHHLKKKTLTSWQTSQDWQFGSRRKGKALQPQVPAIGLMLFMLIKFINITMIRVPVF